MALKKECSIAALEANIATEIRAGRPRAQAVAIAHQTLRDTCKDKGKPVPTRKAFEVIAGQPTVGVKELSGDDKLLPEWMQKNDISLEPDAAFESGGVEVELDHGIVALVAKRKHRKRERTREFLEGALDRARGLLNPRDYAVIFQAARASAGGQISAKRRKERRYSTAAEKQLIEKTHLRDMSKAELRDLERTLNNAYRRNEKADMDNGKVLSRARSLLEEMRRRGIDPEGRVYVALRGSKTRKAVDAHGCDIATERYVAGVGCVKKDAVQKAPKSTRVINNLPDSSFAVVLPGGKKDDEGKMVPRSLRKLPFKNADGSVDKPRLRNALARLNQTDMPADAKAKARRKLNAAARRELPTSEAAQETKKGFANGDPEGGMHAHGLDRRNAKTLNDGGHLHLWVLPGTGELVLSDEDGSHQHAITEGGDATEKDGLHSHKVLLPSGALIETKLAGAHVHQLMVETSGFDGLHKHIMIMPDGLEIESMSPADFVASLEGDPPKSAPMPFASLITRAMNDLRMEREAAEIGGPLPAPLPELSEAVELAIKGESVPPPTFTVEVIAAGDYPGFDAELGDMMEVRHDGEVIGFSKHVVPDDLETIAKATEHWDLISRHTTPVPFTGPEDARLMFVAAAPNELELARKSALVGEDAITFRDIYLKPLGLSRSDIAAGFAMPTLPYEDLNPALCEKWGHHLIQAMKTYQRARVVALGKVARDVLKSAGVEFWSLPHPSIVRRRRDSGEVARKLKAIAKTLDVPPLQVAHSEQRRSEPSKGGAPGTLADAISEMRKTGRALCRVIKSDHEKQIVYGVVLDPYEIDLQTEWVPPSEIESTAHGFLKKSRVIGFEHLERAEAAIVESWVEIYPTNEDYKAALENRPHRAFVRKFGDDVIHSGTWMAGVQLGDREWALHKQGKLNAFSVGGFSFKMKVTTAAMPEVEFIELIAA